jgi:hypothetical protein
MTDANAPSLGGPSISVRDGITLTVAAAVFAIDRLR